MFGSKRAKQDRLAQVAQTIEANCDKITSSQLAKQMGRSRSALARDLADLEAGGVKLCEDERGRLSLLERWFGKK